MNYKYKNNWKFSNNCYLFYIFYRRTTILIHLIFLFSMNPLKCFLLTALLSTALQQPSGQMLQAAGRYVRVIWNKQKSYKYMSKNTAPSNCKVPNWERKKLWEARNENFQAINVNCQAKNVNYFLQNILNV